MEKIDWTKPIEWVNSAGDVFNAEFVMVSEFGLRTIATPHGNIYCNDRGELVGGIPGCVRNRATETEPAKTLRDQFAMAALSGMLSDYRVVMVDRTGATVASAAYEYADAMLEARNK